LAISFGSINSGLPKDIVKQLMEAEKIPIKQMEARKSKFEDKKVLVKELIGLMESVQGEIFKNKGSRSFRELEVVTDDRYLGVTVDKNLALPGIYDIEVISKATKSSAMSNPIEDKDKTYLGVGYIEYTLPNGEEKEVFVDADHSSLTGIAKLLNQDSDNGMHATVVNDGKEDGDEHWRIIITLDDMGDGNKADFPYLYFVDGEVDLYLEAEKEAHDAKIKLDGFEIEVGSNTLDELIPGVTIDLKKAMPGEEISLEIKEDVTKIADKIDLMIENINGVIAFIKKQNQMDEKTDTSRTLGGDITLQQLEMRIRSSIFTAVPTDSGAKRLGDLGVSFQRDGMLKFDTAQFENALKTDFKMVSQVLNGKYSIEDGKTKGFIDVMGDLVQTSLRNPNGLLSNRKKSLQSNIDRIDRSIESKQRHMDQKEQMLKAKFARLEETISKIKTQGAGLAALGGGGFNPVQQLG
jgi:flagellar hook-associated protein 2